MADYTDVIASLLGGGLAHPAWPSPPVIGNLSSFTAPGVSAGSFGAPLAGVGGGGSNVFTPGVFGGSGSPLAGVSAGSGFDLAGVQGSGAGALMQGVVNYAAIKAREDAQAAKEGKATAGAAAPGVQNRGRTGGPAPADVPAEYRPTLEQAAAQYGVDPTLLAAQFKQESGWNPRAQSSAGAVGVAQFTAGTALQYGLADRTDPHASIRAAANYMSDLLKQYNGDQTLALVAYNGGGGAVAAWQAGRPYAESRAYVDAVTANQQAYRAQNTATSSAAIAQGQAQSQAYTGAALAAGAAPVNNGYVFPVVGYRGAIPQSHGGVAGGADIMADEGTPVVAMRAGTVTLAGQAGPGGNAVQIQGDDGLMYYYAHLQYAPQVRRGQQVTAGTPLGAVGRTGNAAKTAAHLHIGIGPTISEGTGPPGGTGGSYPAYPLLQQAYGAGPGP